MSIRYCKKCLFPDTKPDLYFDSEGVCDACRTAEKKHQKTVSSIDWKERANRFQDLISEAKNNANGWYDCIIPVSGGKDSTWQVHAMKKIHKMNPLAVTFDQFDQTKTGLHNLDILRSIGVDHVHFTLNPSVVRTLVRKGFELVGDPYWVNHVGMFTVPFHFAARFNIPLVIYGENPQFEYGGPEESRNNFIMDKRWRQEFGGMRGLREEDMSDYDISIEDLRILQYPDDELVQRLKIKGLFYGFFFKWNAIEHTEKMKKIGWTPLNQPPSGSHSSHENCDMQFIDIREHVKFLKYGYGRASDQLNIEIRQGLITRAEALSRAIEIDGRVNEANVDAFCKFLDISTEEYNNIVDSFVNTEIFERGHNGNWTLKIKRS